MVSDLRYVLRTVGRRPGFYATVVVTLALGLGLLGGVFSFADGYLFRPLPFPSSEQLYRVRDPHAKIALLETDTIALRQAAVGEFGFVEWSAGGRVRGDAIIVDGRQVPVWSYDVSPGFAETLNLPLLAGRTFGEADHRESPTVPVWVSHPFGSASSAETRRFSADRSPLMENSSRASRLSESFRPAWHPSTRTIPRRISWRPP